MTTESNDFKELFRRALAKVNELKAELSARDAAQSEPIAVIGMACRIPGGGNTPESFWQGLCNGIDTVKRLPSDRWVAEALESKYPESKWASLLDTETLERFDAEFFSISAREANLLDPQQRLLLEVAWEALENAGQSANMLLGSRTSVYVGLWRSDYSMLTSRLGIRDAHNATGALHSASAGRISYILGLQGPSMTVDTACSSSLVTVHLACQSLRLRESDLALAGGSNVILDPEVMLTAPLTHALSPDGQCKSFDAQANGYVRGEGCGMLVLKRLSDAERDGDPILGVILSSAVNQDGRSTGLTVPNVLAQQALIREALQNAKIEPGDIGYVETHGTGTSLGDPIEFEALRGVIGGPRANGSSCVLGAVKTNIGHTETAAGAIGMIKTLLCLTHEEIPKNLHFEALNPRISLDGTPFVIPTEHQKWPAGAKPRRAAVSAFGIAGTNAHVIVQEAPKVADLVADAPDTTYVLPLSAKSPAALEALVRAYLGYLPASKDPLGDIVYTAACRRSHLEHRLAVLGRTKDEFVAALELHAAGKPSARVYQGKASGREPHVVLAFSGQGAQWVGMGRELLQQSPRFRQAVEECEKLIVKAGGGAVIAELAKGEGESLLHRTEVAQPALFSIQVGLWAELQARGVQPAVVIGHSVGEVAAAYVSGMLDLETACRVVVARALAMKDQAGRGKMYAVDLGEAEALAALQGASAEVSVAACNGPRSVVLAGETSALQKVIAKLENAGTKAKELRVDYAFHSPQMAEAEQTFLRTVGPIDAKRSSVKMISTVTGQELKASDCNAAYWGRNIRQTVRFTQAVAETLRIPNRVFVEMGPHPVLGADIGEQLSLAKYAGKVIPTLRRNQAGKDQLLTTLAALHVQGVSISWAAEFTSRRRVVPLPNYPWQRKRYFHDLPKAQAKQQGIASQYYDAVTKLVETIQDEAKREDKDRYNLYLTFAPMTEIVPGFSWMKTLAKPQDYQDNVNFIQEKQLEMRQVLFRHVAFDKCARALDFGCGFSTDILHLAERHPQLMLDGYTISAEQAEVGNRRLTMGGMKDRVHVYNRDSSKDAFPNKYDLVFGFEVAHHIKDKAALFGNIREHANEGATLVLADFISHVGFEIEHDASSSFFLTVDQWTELLSAAEFELQDIVDCSRQISNFLYDPDFDAHLEQMRQAGEDENVLVGFQSYDRLGKMLDRGLSSYILLSAKKVDGKSIEDLREHNRNILTNLTPYAIPGSEAAQDNELLFGVEWRRTTLPNEARPTDGWLLIAQREETTAALAKQLAHQGVRVVRVHAGEGYTQSGTDQYRMQLSSTNVQRMLEEAFGHEKPLTRAVYLEALETRESTSAAELCANAVDLCSEATSLVQGLVSHGFRTAPRLYIVTRGAYAVGSSSVQVGQSPLVGLGRTIALEHPELKCVRLDLDPSAPIDSQELLRETSGADREDQLALRGGERFVARFVRAPAGRNKKNDDANMVRAGRSYLVTGGLGGLGLSLARWFVERGAGSVFLMSRHAPTAQAQEILDELNRDGQRVIAVQGDVGQEADVIRVLKQIEKGDKPLAGVIHAAGVLRDKTLLEQSRESFQDVFVPKVMGGWNLHRHVANETLDFFVLYSSTAALSGSPGQANYCAANAFLDGLAHLRVQQGQKALSIQWGAFSDVGMAVAQENRGKRVAGLGAASLSPSEGHQLLEKLVFSSLPNVGVVRLNVRQWVESMPNIASLPYFSDLAKSVGGPRRGKAAAKLLAKLGNAHDQEKQALLLEHLSEQIGVVLQQDPSQLDPHLPFQNMGVDSLLSLEIRNRLEESVGVHLGATVLYTYATLTALTTHLLESLGFGVAPKEEPARIELSGQTAEQLGQLSDDELARMGESLLL